MAAEDIDETEPERRRELDRVAAFGDGVFAIAATLLVLSIDIPHVHADLLAGRSANLFRPAFSYFLSFAVVGVFWLNHHRLLGRMQRSDTGFAVRSLVFLAFVAFLPAPTELIGDYPARTGSVILYALTVLILSLLAGMLGRYADARGLTSKPAPAREWIDDWAVIIAFGLSIAVAFIAPEPAMYVWILAAVLPRVFGRRTSATR